MRLKTKILTDCNVYPNRTFYIKSQRENIWFFSGKNGKNHKHPERMLATGKSPGVHNSGDSIHVIQRNDV